MEVIRVANVQQALPEACYRMDLRGVETETRNGKALTAPGAWTTVYENPNERVLFWEQRDANPFFHLAECIWMLGGRDDVAWISEFSSNIGQFSDDGKRFGGAYGHRWRLAFGFDQLTTIIRNLTENPNCRRQVLTMWSPNDLVDQSRKKDVPCNTQAFFQVAPNGKLDLMVMNRSNDLVWGAYGANAVHFSFLLEVVAAYVGVEVGTYTQVSMNTHVYERHYDLVQTLKMFAPDVMAGQRLGDLDPYALREVTAHPVVENAGMFSHDITLAMEFATRGYSNPFFPDVYLPMVEAWRIFKENKDWPEKRVDLALERLEGCRAPDWKRAATEWLERRRTPKP